MADERQYEVVVYNKDVRERVEAGTHHRSFEDTWADLQHVEVMATDPDQARRRIASRHPANRGFVIVDVIEMQD